MEVLMVSLMLGVVLGRLASLLYLILPPSIEGNLERADWRAYALLSPVVGSLALPDRKQALTILFIELAVIVLITALLSPYVVNAAAPSGFSVLLIAALVSLIAIDLHHMLLPDALTKPLVVAGLIVAGVAEGLDFFDHLWGATIGYVSLYLLNKVFYLLRGVDGIGQGDFKLLAAAGAWFGSLALVPIVLIASLLAVCTGLIYRFHSSNNESEFPFGPAICAASLAYLFYPEAINWFILDLS